MANIHEMNHFTQAEPELKIGRSVFREDEEWKGTFSSGTLVPLYCKDVIPGDTFQIGMNFVIRMLSPVVPPLDNCWLDVFAFYVPSRVLCEKYHLTIDASTGEDDGDWETYLGENKKTDWAPESETYLKTFYPCSYISCGYNGGSSGTGILCNMPQSIADYLGYAVGVAPIHGSSSTSSPLPAVSDQYGNEILCDETWDFSDYEVVAKVNGLDFAAFDYIYNMKFRNPNFQAMTLILQSGNLAYGGDTFCTPSHGDFLNGCFTLPYGSTVSGTYDSSDYLLTGIYYPQKAADYFTSCLPEPYYSVGDISLYLGDTAPVTIDTISGLGLTTDKTGLSATNNTTVYGGSGYTGVYMYQNSGVEPELLVKDFTPSGTADLSDASAVTVNELRELITIQHLAENFARCGTLYPEILLGNFGVRPSDSAIQYPELLGAHRFAINTTQVTAQSVGSGVELGTVGAYSKTVGSDEYLVSKSFTEHGRLMVIGVVRCNQAYSQGTPKRALKYRRFDEYWPEFAHLGEQPVMASELYAWANKDQVFGYQEAYADLKTGRDSLHGYLRPEVGDNTLAPYTYQLAYNGAPKLSAEFMAQSSKQIGNTLYDTQTESQFLADIYWSVKAIRPVPVFSIPGVDRV